MTAHRPSLMQFGQAQIISPDGSHTIADHLWPELAVATLLEQEPAMLADYVRAIEIGLGVHDAHRRALETSVDGVLAGNREAKRRAILERAERAARVGSVERDPDMVAKIDAKLAELAEAVAAVPPADAGSAKSRRAVRKAEALVAKLRGELEELQAQERAQLALYGVAAEPIIRAKLRGEDVEAYEAETAEFALDEHGARQYVRRKGRLPGDPSYRQALLVISTGLRAKKLTGIEHALANGHLSAPGHRPQRLYQTGVTYREAFEALDPLRAAGTEAGGGGYGPKAPQIKTVQAGQTLADMRAGLSPRQRAVLDLVCGKDMRVREAATAMGAGFPATERALRGGLAAAAESLAVERQRRADAGERSVAAGLSAVNAMIARARA